MRMLFFWKMRRRVYGCSVILIAFGCGTTRQTDTTRAATEMLLVSGAIDRAVSTLDFSVMKGRAVFLDTEFLDKATVDRGYLVSSVREKLLANGVLLKDESKQAEFVVEVRAGGVGTDRSSLLVGTPAITMPALLPGVPTSIPEIAIYKRNDQKGVAKIGVFAYHKATGLAVWQSEIVEEASNLKDRWLLGSGPYTTGSIRKRASLAGDPLPNMPKIPYITSEHPPASDMGVAPATLTIPAPDIPPVTPQSPAALGLLGSLPAAVSATK